MKNLNVVVLSAGDDISRNGTQIDSNQLMATTFQAIFGDATAAGTIKVQASNDIYDTQYLPKDFTVTNWSDIPNATSTVTAGVAPLITIESLCYRWIRVVYTSSVAGSSTIKVSMFAIAA